MFSLKKYTFHNIESAKAIGGLDLFSISRVFYSLKILKYNEIPLQSFFYLSERDIFSSMSNKVPHCLQ